MLSAQEHSNNSTGRNSALKDTASPRSDAPWSHQSQRALKVMQGNTYHCTIYFPTSSATICVQK